MRTSIQATLSGLLVACLLILGSAQMAMALGTPSGTSIDNSATLDYSVGGISQTQIVSNTASFVVDNKVDLTVTTVDGAAVVVVPGSNAMVLTYLVTNTGNTVQDYSLTALAGTGTFYGVTDNFDATNVQVFVDANGNGIYDVGVDVQTYIDELAADGMVTVFVVADIPIDRVDSDGAIYDLMAQTAQGGTPGAQGADILNDDNGHISPGGTPNDIPDDPATVQIVFADQAGSVDGMLDGRFSSRDVYVVGSAILTILKNSVVVSDPFNGATNPKAIPGATIRYTIDIANSGSTNAEAVVVSDQIPANTTFVSASVNTANSNGAATVTIEYSADGVSWSAVETSPVAYIRVTNSVVDANDGVNDGTAQVTFDAIIN
ncbi:MAG TPA: DUF11 domain-containing protein [candidate division Zixibacteria bacterium]|nr:DUF11 domain-containing protein [candidate division Zixibacteria bacterium]